MTTPEPQSSKTLTAQRERQAKYQAKLDALTPLQVLRWKLERHDPASADAREIYTPEEEHQLAALKDMIAAAEVLAGEVNRSVIPRLEKTKMTPEVGAMLFELKAKTVRYTVCGVCAPLNFGLRAAAM